MHFDRWNTSTQTTSTYQPCQLNPPLTTPSSTYSNRNAHTSSTKHHTRGRLTLDLVFYALTIATSPTTNYSFERLVKAKVLCTLQLVHLLEESLCAFLPFFLSWWIKHERCWPIRLTLQVLLPFILTKCYQLTLMSSTHTATLQSALPNLPATSSIFLFTSPQCFRNRHRFWTFILCHYNIRFVVIN